VLSSIGQCVQLPFTSAAVQMKGIQPMWRDLMSRHKQQPLQLAVGGGDQLYNDELWRIPSLKK